MGFLRLAFCFLIWALGVFGDRAFAKSPCPTTAEAWSEWRGNVVQSVETFHELSSKVGLFYKCQKEPGQEIFFNSPQFLTCMYPLQAAAWRLGPEAAPFIAKFTVPDDVYFKQSRLDIPAIFDLPPPLQDEKFLENFTGLFVKNSIFWAWINWLMKQMPGSKVLEYTSRFLDDGQYIIHVPRGDFEQWIHFHRSWMSGLMGGVRVVSIQTRDRFHKPLPKPKVFFNIYFSGKTKDGRPRLLGRHEEKTDGSRLFSMKGCAECHHIGAMSIVPTEAYSFTKGQSGDALVSWMNERIGATAGDFDSVIPEALGPPMGPVDPPHRTDAFVRQCDPSSKLSIQNIQRVKKSMNCMQCHDGRTLGAISNPAFGGFGTDIIATMIESGHMPPGADLNQDERRVLLRCLLDEYYGGVSSQSSAKAPKPGLFLQSLTATACPTSAQLRQASTPLRAVIPPALPFANAIKKSGPKEQ